jgi:hypothetical protein
MSNSIGDLRNSGLQGNNFPWQLKMLQGLQAIYDEVKKPLTCAEDSINICNTTGIPVIIDCNDRISLCVDGNVVNASNALPVAVTQANDSIQVFASNGTTNQAVLVGQQACSDSLAVTLCNDQAKVLITPVLKASANSTGNLTAYSGSSILSISFANDGTAAADVSVDGAATYIKLAPGMTINLDANGVMNYYDPDLFYWNTSLTPGASLLIAFNYI